MNKNINSLALAYLGDAVYELYIRSYLLNGNKKVNDLQNEAIKFVSAKAQSKFLDQMLENNFLDEEEINIGISVKKGNAVLKNAIDAYLKDKTADDFNALMQEAIKIQPLSE